MALKKKYTGRALALVLSNILNLITGIFSRALFVRIIAVEYLGITSLYSNILGLLSLAELGVGSALEVRLYKPLVDNDEKRIQNILSLARKLYATIGIIVFALGLCFSYFVPFLIKNSQFSNNYIRLCFIINCFGISLSYFMADKRLYLTANEKLFIPSLSDSIIKIVTTFLGLLVLYFTKEYLFYLLIISLQLFISNFILFLVTKSIRKNIPKMGKDDIIQKEEKKFVLINLKQLIPNKISNVIFSSTDSIVISFFIGLSAVAYYGNYYTIVSAFFAISALISTSLFSVFGKAVQSQEDKQLIYKKFASYEIVNFLYSSLCCIGMIALLNNVVVFWMGNDSYLLDKWTVILMIMDFYVHSMYQPCSAMFIATQKFKEDKYFSFISMGLNLVISIVCAIFIGLPGVILGTFLSDLFTYVTRRLMISKNYFNKRLFLVIIKDLVLMICTFALGFLCYFLCSILSFDSLFLNIFIGIFICFGIWIVPALILATKYNLISFHKRKIKNEK